MVGGSSLDFALNIPKSSKEGLDYVEDKLGAIVSTLKNGLNGGKKFVSQVLQRASKSGKELRKMFVPFDKKNSKQHNDAMDGMNSRLYMYGRLTEGISGGISLLNNKFLGFIATAYLFKESFEMLAEANDDFINQAKKNILTFGSLSNSMNAYRKVQADVISGRLRGDVNDITDAMAELNKMGVQVTDELNMSMNNLARVTGESQSDVAGRINSFAGGDLQAFDDVFGPNALRSKYAGLEGNQRALTSAILKELQGNQKLADAAKKMPVTFKEIGQQLSTARTRFIQEMFGNTSDPNSFASRVIRSMKSVIEYFRGHAETFKKIAGFIQAVFTTVWSVIASVFNRLVKPIFDKFFNFIGRTLDNFKDTTAGLVLYITLVGERVITFLQNYGKYILYAYAALKAFGLGTKVFHIGKDAIGSVHRYFRVMKVGMWRMNKAFPMIGQAISKVIPFIKGMNLAMLANPIGLIVIAVIALITYIVLLVKYWEEIRVKMQGVSDTVITLIAVFFPLVGIPMLLAKHWGKFKVIFINIWTMIENVVLGTWYNIQYGADMAIEYLKEKFNAFVEGVKFLIAPVVEAFSVLWSSLKDIMPDWLMNIGSTILKGIKSAYAGIVETFNSLWANIKPDWLTDVIDFFGDASKKGADASKGYLERAQERSGKTVGAKGGTTTRGIDEKKLSSEALAVKKAKELPSSPLLNPTNSASTSSGASSLGGDNVTNNVTINVPDGMSRAEVKSIIEEVFSAKERRQRLAHS